MNKEQQELVDEAYKNFIYNPSYKAEGVADLMESQAGQLVKCPTQEDFINKIKTDTKFSERWGLKIEERELSRDERIDLYCKEYTGGTKGKYEPPFDDFIDAKLTTRDIPTKLITITYNDKTIESYE